MKNALSYEDLRLVVSEQQDEIAHLRKQNFIERDKFKELSQVIDKSWIKIIIGIRRCGKSVMAHQALKNKEYGYLNFDDERLVGLTATDLNKLLQFLLELNPKIKVLFFDEIQNVEGWELFVNRLQRQGYNLVITGSSSNLLVKELSVHLVGRYICIKLMPFSFREFLRAKKFKWSSEKTLTPQEKAPLYSYLNEYIQEGGFPDMVLKGYNANYLRELYDKIIYRNITYSYHIRHTKILKKIALYSHANLGGRLTFHKVKNIFDIASVHTIKNYFQYLNDAYLVFLLNAFSYKYKEQVRAPRKAYSVDNGLSAAISPKFTQDRGKALENLVFQELLRRNLDFSYYAATDCEVDFVLHSQKQASSLIQVALTMEDETTRKREIKALVKAASDLKCSDLIIVTWEEEGIEEIDGNKITILPIWKWLLS